MTTDLILNSKGEILASTLGGAGSFGQVLVNLSPFVTRLIGTPLLGWTIVQTFAVNSFSMVIKHGLRSGFCPVRSAAYWVSVRDRVATW